MDWLEPLVERLKAESCGDLLFFWPHHVPYSMWDLNSLTRDRTLSLSWEERGVLTAGPPEKSV